MAALTVGDHVPNFALPDQKGTHWVLSKELHRGPVVLVFYRGDW